jgi:hypothetical protein
MVEQQPLGHLGWHVVSLVGEAGRQPQRLAGELLCLQVGFTPTRVGDGVPDEARPDDEPDDEQPPVELGVHRREV